MIDQATLGELHDVLQVVMGWTDSHLHLFEQSGVHYKPPGGGIPGRNERRVSVRDVLRSEKDSLRYEYDFGDGWEHKVVLEKKLPFDESMQLPRCIKGRRACPPEDCGGPWGYEALLTTIRDPQDGEHEELLEWVGDDFDPEHFSADEVNEVFDEYWK